MGYFTSILTVAKWEVLRNLRSMSRNVLPPAVLLFIILVLASAFAAQSGIHLQDGMYRIGVNDPAYSTLFSG
ncbi:MAG: PrsW family intramembrane metalloprotease, partial [Methanomicrobiales archaeon]|nr:PrsW family intramembrane metalloprotease [Methanomicrobiales archaeon]